MDASDVFRHIEGLGTYQPRFPQGYHPPGRPAIAIRDEHVEEDGSHRIAHTLTACCRCRQRKTRCDPTLPRCLPCERSGSVCEYFDTTKGKKISRYYVVKLQARVRALEAELGQYTDEDSFPQNNDDIVGPGGLVRLNETDETPRYLGPSSGIAMTRILMEEAKRYTDSQHISQLIPEVRGRRQAAVGGPGHMGLRSQSFSIPPPMMSRKKSYPMISAFPADSLPSRAIADKLVEVYCQRGQILTPTLHENRLASDLDDVYNGSQDAYQHFVIGMVMAISMQKLDTGYAGLADSYYLASMQRFEEVVRPKDLKTIQCLALIGQYSLLTPTRTSVYYIIGLATRICQQLGLADEKTIAMGTEDPLTLDMRRRLSWTITAFEFGLASSMGRPNGFAKSDDIVDVKFFESAKDENITEHGILQGPADEKKLIAIHFCKMRLCQSEINRVLYEKKQPEPRDERHPWFAAMETKLDQWLDASPASPAWCKPWFTGKYHTMVISLHRPSPQVPKPSSRSAVKCFDSAAFIIDLSSKQMMAAAVDITWVFVFTLYMALNTLLWSVAAYPDVRGAHSRDEVEELVNVALDILDQCADRWPGIKPASELYSTFSKACLRSYEARHTPVLSVSSTFGTPSSQQDMNSPSASDNSSATTVSRQGPTNGAPAFNPPQFGYVFNTAPEPVSFDNPFAGQPTFRSNSIFHNPAPSDPSGRRFSYFPPEFTQSNENLLLEESTPPESDTNASPPLLSPPNHLPTPPESVQPGASATPTMSTPMLPASAMATPNLTHASPVNLPQNHAMGHPQQQQQQQRNPAAFAIPPLPPNHHPQGQRPLPQTTTVNDWFNPPPPFISPYTFGAIHHEYWAPSNNPNGLGVMGLGDTQMHGMPPERQGSLSHAQQAELMGVLENEGMTDIDTYLSLGGMGYGTDMRSNGTTGMNWAG
ncbi:uncharacterized protein PG986_012530 [Apiospora aurea]|uniref:Zn(2)-C6 fungal-type domain-containing protein n=1 Tax=Apiospora aurea TaxID=335848 RepID=A0ABR1Q0W0_9PEZI